MKIRPIRLFFRQKSGNFQNYFVHLQHQLEAKAARAKPNSTNKNLKVI